MSSLVDIMVGSDDDVVAALFESTDEESDGGKQPLAAAVVPPRANTGGTPLKQASMAKNVSSSPATSVPNITTTQGNATDAAAGSRIGSSLKENISSPKKDVPLSRRADSTPKSNDSAPKLNFKLPATPASGSKSSRKEEPDDMEFDDPLPIDRIKSAATAQLFPWMDASASSTVMPSISAISVKFPSTNGIRNATTFSASNTYSTVETALDDSRHRVISKSKGSSSSTAPQTTAGSGVNAPRGGHIVSSLNATTDVNIGSSKNTAKRLSSIPSNSQAPSQNSSHQAIPVPAFKRNLPFSRRNPLTPALTMDLINDVKSGKIVYKPVITSQLVTQRSATQNNLPNRTPVGEAGGATGIKTDTNTGLQPAAGIQHATAAEDATHQTPNQENGVVNLQDVSEKRNLAVSSEKEPPVLPVGPLKPTMWDEKYPLLSGTNPSSSKIRSSNKREAELSEAIDEPIILTAHGYVVPNFISKNLRDYQIEGVRWIMTNLLNPQRPTGCILGDDMGLGKTVQVVTFLGALYFTPAERRPRTALIVAPPSLMENWKQEFARWGPFNVEIYNSYDSGPTRSILARANAGLLHAVIASRGLLSQNAENYCNANVELAALLQMDWGAVIVDEVHECKNPMTRLSTNVAKLRSRRKLGLTGTPVANKIGEFWAVLRCVGEHKRYGTREEFDAKYSNPIAEGMRKNIDNYKIARREAAAKEFKEKVLAAHFLRRTKAEAGLNLPGKKDRIVACPLSPLQLKCYANLLKSKDVQAVLRKKTDEDPFQACACIRSLANLPIVINADQKSNLDCFCNMGVIWRNQHRGQMETGEKSCKSWNHPWRCHALSLISYLQKIANHLDLVQTLVFRDPTQLNPEERRHREFELSLCRTLFEDTEMEADFAENADLSSTSLKVRMAKMTQQCGKLHMLLKLLKLWNTDGNKVLLFSRSTKLLGILQMVLTQEGYRLLRLDGATPTKLRQQYCTEFNSTPEIYVFLISTRAGGVGLNLTGANKVVIFDPDWNPCLDLQAQDRSFRIGQTRFVEVFRLLSAGTVEEHMYLRQLYKQQVMRISIDQVKTARRLDREQLEGLERFFVLDTRRISDLIIDDLEKEGRIVKDDERKFDSKAMSGLEDELDEELKKAKEDGCEEIPQTTALNQPMKSSLNNANSFGMGLLQIKNNFSVSNNDFRVAKNNFGDVAFSSDKLTDTTNIFVTSKKTNQFAFENDSDEHEIDLMSNNEKDGATALQNGLNDILGAAGVQEFDHDLTLRKDTQEVELAEEAEDRMEQATTDRLLRVPQGEDPISGGEDQATVNLFKKPSKKRKTG